MKIYADPEKGFIPRQYTLKFYIKIIVEILRLSLRFPTVDVGIIISSSFELFVFKL